MFCHSCIARASCAERQNELPCHVFPQDKKIDEKAEITLETLKSAGVMKCQGKEAKLPLKARWQEQLLSPLSVALPSPLVGRSVLFAATALDRARKTLTVMFLSPLSLQILADGDVSMPLKVSANAISAAAQEKLAAAGGAFTKVEGRKKWLRWEHEKAAAEAAKSAPAKGKAAAAKKK